MNDKTKQWSLALMWCALIGFAALVLVFSVAWLKVSLEDHAARIEIQKRMDAIRAAGQPLTAQDLAKLYPDPPPEHDALLILKPALAALVVPNDSTNLPIFSRNWPAGPAPLEKPVLDEIQSWIGKNQAALDSVPWEKLNGAWIGSGFAAGLTNLPAKPVSKVLSLAKLSCLDAILEAEFQHPKEAAQSLQHALLIERTLKNDTPLHGMMKYFVENLVCSSLSRVLNRTTVPDSDLASLTASLTATNLGATKMMLIQERCLGLSMAYAVKSAANQATSHVTSPVRLLIKSFEAKAIYRDQDLLNYLEWCDSSLAVLDLPLSKAIPALRATEKAQSIFIERHHFGFLNSLKKDRVSLFTLEEELEMSKLLLPEADIVAHVRVTRTAVAIERWRLVHNNRLPDSLAELAPNLIPPYATDPYDDQPLRYKKLAHGYVVYSIGPDFVDDGGKEEPPDTTDSTNYDITFIVQRQNLQ